MNKNGKIAVHPFMMHGYFTLKNCYSQWQSLVRGTQFVDCVGMVKNSFDILLHEGEYTKGNIKEKDGDTFWCILGFATAIYLA